MVRQLNSMMTRVRPVFEWLEADGGPSWPEQLVKMAQGTSDLPKCGSLVKVYLNPERKVPASRERLSWMLRNAEKLVPIDGKRWTKLLERVADRKKVEHALACLDAGQTISRKLILEGNTHADCLIECEEALIWIEGKRCDWLAPSIKWDVSRDQLARDVEAAWLLAQKSGKKKKDYRVILCHEGSLKHHEIALLEGYRQGTWSAGWPHIREDQRSEFSTRIGTLTWSRIAEEWPALRKLRELHDL